RVLGILGMSVGTNLVIAIGFVGVMLLFGDLLLGIFRLDLSMHATVFVLAVANAAIMSLAAPLGPVPVSAGYTWTGLAITAGWAATFIGGTWLLRDLGAEGAFTARLIAWTVQSIVYVFFTHYVVRKVCAVPQGAS